MADDWSWKQRWDAVARGKDPYGQMGRMGWTLPHFVTLVAQLAEQGQLGPDDVVLDAGGGAGWVAALWAPFVKKVIVVDYAPVMAARAVAAAKSVEGLGVVQDDVRTLEKVPDDLFTCSFCVGVLQYLDDLDQVAEALHTLQRVTASGGRVVLGHNPDLTRKQAWEASYAEGWSEERKKSEAHRLWFEPGQLEALAEEAGLVEPTALPIHPMLPGAEFMSSFVVTVP